MGSSHAVSTLHRPECTPAVHSAFLRGQACAGWAHPKAGTMVTSRGQEGLWRGCVPASKVGVCLPLIYVTMHTLARLSCASNGDFREGRTILTRPVPLASPRWGISWVAICLSAPQPCPQGRAQLPALCASVSSPPGGERRIEIQPPGDEGVYLAPGRCLVGSGAFRVLMFRLLIAVI